MLLCIFLYPRAPLLLKLSRMGVQPKDLIATLPQLHEKSPSSPPSSPPFANPPPDASLAGAVPIPTRRDDSFAENGMMRHDGESPSGELTPPVSSSVPVSSSRFPKFSKKKRNRSESYTTDPDQFLQLRSDVMLRRDHYVSLKNASKCSNENCRRRFKWPDRKRNCRMCGEVFCWKCTKLMRKLSSNAEPDSLGAFHNVCEKCYNVNPRSGRYRDRKYEFDLFRLEARKRMIASSAAAESTTPLSAQQSSKCKSDQLRVELNRLVKGYENQSALKGLVGTQNWQKSALWVPDAKATECFLCKKKFRLTMRKINCRVCGQVFCRECTKYEILLFCLSKNSPASWAINGKEGGPASKPHRFETYPICNGCCSEMEEILLTNMHETPPPEGGDNPFQSHVMDDIVALQSELSTLQKTVEKNLPIYQCLVDTLGIEDSSPRSIGGDHPLRELVKVQSDLSDTFTHMANRSQALKNLSTTTETQKRLLQHLMLGMFHFYQEYMYLFKSAQLKLKEMIPMETLCVIQEYLDKQSMERVHLTLRQLTYELLNIEKKHQCKLDFIHHLALADEAIVTDLRPLIQKANENWEDHLTCVNKFILDGFTNKPMVQLQRDLPREGPNYQIYVRYFTLGRTTSLISQCIRELEAKTKEKAFLETKSSLARAGKHATTELKAITDKLAQTPKK